MAAPQNNNGGAVNDQDVEHWKKKVNEVLSKPGEHINSKSPADAQPWAAGLFDCFNPIDLCLLTYCLPCVTFGKTYHRLRNNGNLNGYEPINTTCLLFCASGWCGLHWVPMSIQRADARAKYNLQGDCVTDIALSCCCILCTLVQTDKEVEAREAAGAGTATGVKEPYQSTGGMVYPAEPPAAEAPVPVAPQQ